LALSDVCALVLSIIEGDSGDEPPGLWLAVSRIPPVAFLIRMIWSAKDAIMADDQLFHAVRCSNFCDELGDFRIPIPSISSNDQSCALCTLWDGQYGACNEGLAVVLLLKDFDFLSKAGALTISVWRS
jgi:hypothetical protein